MNSISASGLTQRWIVVTDERGASLLVATWVSDDELGVGSCAAA